MTTNAHSPLPSLTAPIAPPLPIEALVVAHLLVGGALLFAVYTVLRKMGATRACGGAYLYGRRVPTHDDDPRHDSCVAKEEEEDEVEEHREEEQRIHEEKRQRAQGRHLVRQVASLSKKVGDVHKQVAEHRVGLTREAASLRSHLGREAEARVQRAGHGLLQEVVELREGLGREARAKVAEASAVLVKREAVALRDDLGRETREQVTEVSQGLTREVAALRTCMGEQTAELRRELEGLRGARPPPPRPPLFLLDPFFLLDPLFRDRTRCICHMWAGRVT